MTTKVITNFGGRLTRIVNGDLNSGLAKFMSSWGYDPFTKPQNLTWFEQPTSIAGISDLMLAGKTRQESGTQYIYGISNGSNIYKINTNSISNPNLDSVVGIASIQSGANYKYGASIDFFGNTEKMYITSDNRVYAANFDFTSPSIIGSTSISSVAGHTLRPFVGKMMFGNGNTVGAIDVTGTITSSVRGTGQGNIYSEINPPLPVSNKVQDVDLSPDGNYLMLTASEINPEDISNFDFATPSSGSEGFMYRWNGIDEAVTSLSKIPSYAVTAMQSYLNNNMFFSNDSFGVSMNDGITKLVTLPDNRSPLPNATLVNGNFVSWVAPEVIGTSSMVGSLYYFGGLDRENPVGLYRLLRYSPVLANGFAVQTPLNILTNNFSKNLNASRSSVVTVGYGKHYISVHETSDADSADYKLLRFLVTSTGTGTPQSGVYETQTELFSKRQTIKQVRVYTEPTVANNGFQLDCIGTDGAIITNGTFTYTFAAGTDETLLQGALERINFNPAMNDVYGLGIRLTNTGTVNMTIKKVEVDIESSGK